MSLRKRYLCIFLAITFIIGDIGMFSSVVFANDYQQPGTGTGPDDKPDGEPVPPCPPAGNGDCPTNKEGGQTCAKGGDPVLLNGGEFKEYATDLTIPGRKMSVEITRTYGSRREHNSRFGYGWDINYNMKVRRLHDNDTVILLNGRSCKHEYVKDTGGPTKYLRAGDTSGYLSYDSSQDTFTLVKVRSKRKYAFDLNGNLSSITDRNGNKIQFIYSETMVPLNGKSDYFVGIGTSYGLIARDYTLDEIIDDRGQSLYFSYDPTTGLLAVITDSAGRQWDYIYDEDTNDLLTVTGPSTDQYPNGLTTTYTYDSEHNFISKIYPNNQTKMTNFYDSEDMIWKQTVENGDYTFDYDAANNKTRVVNRRGTVRDEIHNSSGQTISSTIYEEDPDVNPSTDSYTTSYKYNDNYRKVRTIHPGGNSTDYIYDESGDVIGKYYKTSPDEPNDITDASVIGYEYTYDPSHPHEEKTIKDPRGNIITLAYDPNDNLAKITYPEVDIPGGTANPAIDITYNQYGQMETVTFPDDIVTKYAYYDNSNDPNNFGRLYEVIVDYGAEPNCLNITTQFVHDAYGNARETIDPDGNVTKLTYDELNQLIKTQRSLESSYITEELLYDENGNLKESKQPYEGSYQTFSYTHNIMNLVETITDPLDNITTSGYDKEGDPNVITDAEDNSTFSEYDARGLLWKVTDANDGVTEYSYDANANLIKITDAKGNETDYDYDGFNRLLSITYADDSDEVYTYDKNSNITYYENRNGDTIAYEYDALNRVTKKSWPNSERDITYLYDIAGRLVEVNDGNDKTNYYYDRIGRLIDVVDPDDRQVSYDYDDLGRRTQLTYPDDSYITYEYDELSRLTKITDDSSTVLAQYSYDELSRRELLTLGNDANSVYTYDLANRLTDIDNNFNDTASTVKTFDYTHDKVGNRLTMTVDANDLHSYTYDKLYQVTDADYPGSSDISFSYDELGNRTKTDDGTIVTYQSDSLNQYTAVDSNSYTYDNNGNLTDDEIYEYVYDYENRLIEVKEDGVSFATYTYDYSGRRISKTVDGTTTKYCYDGAHVIAEYDGSDTLLRKFVYGPGIDAPICMIAVDGENETAYYYHFDGLGSVIALSDDNGDIVESYSYGVFGETTIYGSGANEISKSAIDNPYMFTARRYDDETGLYYYRARMYNPSIGRFLQPDPLRYYDSMNLYQYCLNNPINYIDPYGQLSCTARCGIVSAVTCTIIGGITAIFTGVGGAVVGLACALFFVWFCEEGGDCPDCPHE